jgi:penicillin-binding protein 1A
MHRAGFLGDADWRAAAAEPIALTRPPDRYGTIAPWLTERARQEAQAALPEAWARGGLVVETAILPVTAEAAQARAREAAEEVGRRQKTAAPQVGAFVFDHVTGYVEAVVGGLDWAAAGEVDPAGAASRFDRAGQACRQPGSAFKPVVYAAALEHDRITPGTPLRDAPITEYDEDRNVFWKPTNSGRAFRGIALAQDALAASLNAPAVDVMDRVGADAAIGLARRLGLSTPIEPVRPLVLGSSCVIPRELARAFGVFAAGGRRVEPQVIVRVTRGGGPALLDRASPYDPFLAPGRRLDAAVDRLAERLDPATAAQVLDAQTAFLMSSMLAEVVRAGTGHNARAVGRPAAGKTGTTNENTDAWFVGYTGRLVAAVWIGHDDPVQRLGPREDGRRAALPVWVRLIALAEDARAPVAVPGPPPPGVVAARIDRGSGLLALPHAGGAVDLWFRAGTAPTQAVDELREVPRDLGRLSRDF